jgi:hypothetical protein
MIDAVVEAINDLTRVTIALSGKFESKSEAVRQMAALSIPNNRIAAILAMSPPDVASILAKDRKKKTNTKETE